MAIQRRRAPVGGDGASGAVRDACIRRRRRAYNTAGALTNCWDYPGNAGAIPPSLALSGDKAAIKAAIDRMTAPGTSAASSGTIIGEGIKWGREVLTSNAPYTQGGDPEVMRKIMILLSDGDNEDGTCSGTYTNDPRYDAQSTYRRNAYWGQSPPVTTCTCVNYGCLDQEMLTQASQAKANDGIEIFVIRYGTSDSTDKALLKAIASSKAGTDDHYFNAPNTSDIGNVFKKIGRQLGFRLL